MSDQPGFCWVCPNQHANSGPDGTGFVLRSGTTTLTCETCGATADLRPKLTAAKVAAALSTRTNAEITADPKGWTVKTEGAMVTEATHPDGRTWTATDADAYVALKEE